MGRWIPSKVDAYRPSSSIAFCEIMQNAILKKIKDDRITSVQIMQKYPPYRPALQQAMESGEILGEKRLFSIAEAIGLQLESIRFNTSNNKKFEIAA